MAALVTQKVSPLGAAVTFDAAAAGGDTFKGTPRGTLHVRNGDASATTVTLVVPGNTAYGQPQPDIAFSVAAGAHAAFGPFDGGLRAANGDVSVTYSKATALTVAYTEIG